MEQISLNGIWKLWGQPQEDTGDPIVLKGTVPGCVQLDLSEAGYLPRDLYIGENILQAEKYETWQWWYERKFNAPDNRENIFLVFEGVDCIAHYYLNGIKIGDSENMFISHEFDVGKHLKAGENTLTVHIESPVLASHKLNYSLNSFTAWNDGQGQAHTGIRKAAHSYGWDIMPRAVTSGIWRDVRLEMRDPISFSQMYFCATATRCEFLYELSCTYSDLGDIEIELEGSCKDSTFHEKKRSMLEQYPQLDTEVLCKLQGGLPALSLCTLTALNTAFCNDVDPDLVYAQAVLGMGKAGDLLICISTSGNAKNVLIAAQTAKALGLTVIGLTGLVGGKLSCVADICISVPETETFKVQELHLPVYHYLCAAAEAHFYS